METMFNKNTRIFVAGDIHGTIDIRKLNTTFWPEQKDLTKNDLLIQVGDFGHIWNNVPSKDEIYWLKWFDAKPFITVFIAGNHDNHDRLNSYPVIDFCGGKASRISKKVYHIKNGYVYNFGERTFWCFGGALSIDKDQRIPGISWWDGEIPSYKEMQMGLDNLEYVGYKVDYIITHTMPRLCIDILKTKKLYDEYTTKYNDPVSAYLDEVLDRMRWGYKRWMCGHFHEDRRLEAVKLTILYDIVTELLEEENLIDSGQG